MSIRNRSHIPMCTCPTRRWYPKRRRAKTRRRSARFLGKCILGCRMPFRNRPHMPFQASETRRRSACFLGTDRQIRELGWIRNWSHIPTLSALAPARHRQLIEPENLYNCYSPNYMDLPFVDCFNQVLKSILDHW